MVGQNYDGRKPNRARFVRPMDQSSLYDHIQKAIGRSDFPELVEVTPAVLSLDPATQHWFTDRVRAAYNAGKTGRAERQQDKTVADKLGPAYGHLLTSVFARGKQEYWSKQVPTVGHDRV